MAENQQEQDKLERAKKVDAELYEEVKQEEQDSDEDTIPYNKLEYFHDVNTNINIQFSKATRTIKEVLQLKEQDIIMLPDANASNIKLFAGDQVMAIGEIVMVNEKYGMRVHDIISDKEKH